MKKTKSFEFLGLAGLMAGLVLSQGCRTTYTEQASAEDLSLRPMPESLTPEATGDVVPLEAPEEKPLPYWKQVQQQGGADADPYAEAVGAEKSASPVPGAPTYTSYTIKKGDTVSQVAVRYGLRWQDVAAVNSGLNINKVRVGQVIRLPGSIDLSRPKNARKSFKSVPSAKSGSSSVYIVKKNDILGRIARAHGVKIADIKKANGLKSDFIREGQKLVIPAKGAVVKAPVAKPKAPQVKKPEVKVTPPAPPVPVAPKEEPDADLIADPVTIPAPVVVPAPAAPAPVPAPAVAPVPAVPAPQAEVKPPAPKPAPGSTFSYRVQENEDLYEIGIHWGVPTDEIRSLNPGCIGADGKIVPGTVLKIPAGAVEQ